MESARCQVIITKGLSQIYQKKLLKVNTLPTWNIGKLPFQCKTKWQKINTIWNEIEDACISIDCASFLSINRILFLCLETIPYIVVSQEICSSTKETLGLYLKQAGEWCGDPSPVTYSHSRQNSAMSGPLRLVKSFVKIKWKSNSNFIFGVILPYDVYKI